MTLPTIGAISVAALASLFVGTTNLSGQWLQVEPVHQSYHRLTVSEVQGTPATAVEAEQPTIQVNQLQPASVIIGSSPNDTNRVQPASGEGINNWSLQ